MQEIYSGESHDFGGIEHSFVGNGGSALGDCLPGVECGSGGECGDIKVDGWDNPAYVTYVGGVFEVAV